MTELRATLEGLRLAMAAGAALAGITLGCGDQCLVHEYAPPSLRLQLRDAETDEPICSAGDYLVSTPTATAIAHEDTCEWWLPGWVTASDAAGTSETELALSVTGYLPTTVRVAIERNACDEIAEPPLLAVDVEPDPSAE